MQAASTGGRGGARNRGDRQSNALTMQQVASLIAAQNHADVIALPLNRLITIHWESAGVRLAAMPAATYRFTDLLAKALRRHGCRTAWVWVHENGTGKGGHCHLLAHVPAMHVGLVTKLQRGWVRLITGQPYRRRAIKSVPVGGRLGVETANPAAHAANLAAALAYILKGADAEAASHFRLDRLEPGGLVIGKRCGTSQNIGYKARASALAQGVETVWQGSETLSAPL